MAMPAGADEGVDSIDQAGASISEEEQEKRQE
jgi:hypothetical protein